jgi:hypothetical protein
MELILKYLHDHPTPDNLYTTTYYFFPPWQNTLVSRKPKAIYKEAVTTWFRYNN